MPLDNGDDLWRVHNLSWTRFLPEGCGRIPKNRLTTCDTDQKQLNINKVAPITLVGTVTSISLVPAVHDSIDTTDVNNLRASTAVQLFYADPDPAPTDLGMYTQCMRPRYIS